MRSLVWLFALGCRLEPNDRDDGSTPTDSEPEDSLVTDFDIVSNGSCEDWTDPQDGEVYQIPGAERYWAGSFDISGTSVSGIEALILFANEEWKNVDEDAADCQVVWTVSGSKGDSQSCNFCEYSISLHAQIDSAASTCSDEFRIAQDQSYDVTYNVDIQGDDATYYFTSGNLLGEGDASSYVSESSCMWF